MDAANSTWSVSEQNLRILLIQPAVEYPEPRQSSAFKKLLSLIAQIERRSRSNRGFKRRQVFAGPVTRHRLSVDVDAESL